MVADPKALRYILHLSGYNFPKIRDVVKLTEMVVGNGLVCAHGAPLSITLSRPFSICRILCCRKDPRTLEKNFDSCILRLSNEVVYPDISRGLLQSDPISA